MRTTIVWTAITVIVLVMTAASLNSVLASQVSRSGVEGVWNVVVTKSAADGMQVKGQRGLYIFTKRYYSILVDTSSVPRLPFTMAKNPQKLTEAEKLARYDHWLPITTNAGTYELRGDNLIRRATIAKNINITSEPVSYRYRVTGNTLTLQTGGTVTELTRLE